MFIAAHNEVHFARDCGFEKFIVFGVVFDELDFFFGNDKFRKLINKSQNIIYGFLLQTKFWTVENFKIFIHHVGGNNDREFFLIPLFQN